MYRKAKRKQSEQKKEVFVTNGHEDGAGDRDLCVLASTCKERVPRRLCFHCHPINRLAEIFGGLYKEPAEMKLRCSACTLQEVENKKALKLRVALPAAHDRRTRARRGTLICLTKVRNVLCLHASSVSIFFFFLV